MKTLGTNTTSDFYYQVYCPIRIPNLREDTRGVQRSDDASPGQVLLSCPAGLPHSLCSVFGVRAPPSVPAECLASSFTEKAEACRRAGSEQPAHPGSAALVQKQALQLNTSCPPHWPAPEDHHRASPQSHSPTSMFPCSFSKALTPYCLYWPLLFSFSIAISPSNPELQLQASSPSPGPCMVILPNPWT